MKNPFILASFGEHAAGGASGRTLNSANAQMAWSFIALDNKTISTVSFLCYSCAGTQASRSLTAAVYSDVNGAVGALVQDGVALTNFTNGILTLTLSFTKVAGTRYHITVRNTAAVPGTDYCSVAAYTGEDLYHAGGGGTGGTKWTHGYSYTTDGWSTSSLASGVSGLVIAHTDGTSWGQLFQASAASAFKIYGTRGEGFVFVNPTGANLNVCGFWMPAYNANSATGNQVGKCRLGSTTYSSVTIPLGNCGQYADPQLFLFSTAIVIPPGSTSYFFLTNSATDDATHYFSTGVRVIADIAAHRNTVPWGGYYCSTTDGTTFTVDNQKRPNSCGVILCNEAEFTAPTFPANAQVITDLASWGFNGEYGPGEVTAEAHTAPEVLTTAVSNPGTYVSPATSIVKLSETYGPSSSYVGTYSATIAAKISSVSPNSDTTSGGSTISIRVFGATATQGTGSIAIGGNTATIISWTPTLITCIAPAHAAGTVDVVFTNPAGDTDTYTNGFTYLALPEDPVKERIIDAIVWGLQQITTAKGYTNTVRRVYDPPVSFLEMEEFPAINVFEGEESCANSNQGSHLQTNGNNAMLHNSFVVTFDCVLTTTPNQSSARGDRIKFLADLQKYFGTNYWIPDQYGRATARCCFYQSSAPFGIEGNRNDLTGITCDFIVWYDQELVNPTVRG